MNAPYSVIFCGTPDFAIPSLKALHEDGDFIVELVITQPDRPVGRKKIMTPSPVKSYAVSNDIPVWQPEKLNKEFEQIPQKNCDFLIVVAYGQIIAQKVLDMPAIMPINVHGSILPRWRGASPLQHSILHGDTEAGVTIQRMVKELDAGPILSTAKIPIDHTITSPVLHDTLAELGATVLKDTLKSSLHEIEQNDDEATFCSKLTREDGNVDLAAMTAIEIDRHVRALVPWPGVTMNIHGQHVKILSTSLVQTEDSMPIECKGNTVLHILKMQLPGRTPISGIEYMRNVQKG